MELSSAASNGVFVCLWVLAKVWLMQGETFCRIQSAQPMMDTRLICFFAEDLRLTKKDFAVFHYVPNQQQDKVVDCHWMEGEMYCSLEPGYEYVQTATSNFSVRIRHVSGKHVGLYECRLNGANGSDVRQCKFTLKPGPCVLELVTSDWMLSSVCNFTGRTQVTDATTCTWLSRQGKEGSALLVDISTGAVFGKTCFFSSILRSDKDGVYSFTVQLTNGLQYETNSVSIGRPSDVYTTCPRYVAEGESVRCECSVRHPGYPPALATWDADGAESTLRKLRVRREEDSTVLGTCYVVWPNHNYPPLHQLTYILRVAYGPEKSKMAIEGPRDVFADGSRKMALTCKVDDVNPAPEITWSGVTCEERAAPGQCVFVTDPAADREIVVSCTATNVHNNGRLATASLVINLNVTRDNKNSNGSTFSLNIIIIGGGAGGGLVIIIIIIVVVVKCRKSGDVNIQNIAGIVAEKQAARKSDSSAGTGAGAAGNDSKSGGSSARSSSSGSDKPSSNPNYTSTALQEVEIHAYMDLHTRDPTYAATASKKDNHTYIELRTKRMQSEPPQPPAEGSRNSAIYANQERSPKAPVLEEEDEDEDEANYYNTAS